MTQSGPFLQIGTYRELSSVRCDEFVDRLKWTSPRELTVLRTCLPLLYLSFSVCLLTIAACGDTERGEPVDEIATTTFAGSQANRVEIRYEPPKDPEHGQVYEEFKRLRGLEKLQEFLSPFRLPRTLTVMSAGCDGGGRRLLWRRRDNDLLRVRRRVLEEHAGTDDAGRRCAHRHRLRPPLRHQPTRVRTMPYSTC